MTIEIAFAFETPSGAVHLAEEGANELALGQVCRRRLDDLDGPNDTLHVLADARTLHLLANAVFEPELVTEMARDTWQKRARMCLKLKTAVAGGFRKIVTACGHMKNRRGGTAVIGLAKPVEGQCVGLDIKSADELEVAWHICMFAAAARDIDNEIARTCSDRSFVRFQRNPDMRTIAIRLNADGTIDIPWVAKAAASSDAEERSTRLAH